MITNTHNIPLALAVWLLNDEYDYISKPNYISATTLMKPLRMVLLSRRMDRQGIPIELADMIPRALGHALHNSVEKGWTSGSYRRALKMLGYPDSIIDRIRVNPTDEEVRADSSIIPVYLEQRMFREIVINGVTYTIGGKYDMVTEGIVQDVKSTSTYAWTKGTKDDDYRLQMSIYRWVDGAQDLPKIQEDFGKINFIFTDWQKSLARSNPEYPQTRIAQREIELLSPSKTEEWIKHKLGLLHKYQNASESDIPECTDEELWRSEPVFKYFSDPNKTQGRSTKNFSSLSEASAFQAEKGGKGVVIPVPGEPKRCAAYCDAFSICSQGQRYFS